MSTADAHSSWTQGPPAAATEGPGALRQRERSQESLTVLLADFAEAGLDGRGTFLPFLGRKSTVLQTYL